ncbi:MAG: glucosamine-6-phosphate deaminase [Chitinophagaceae bacterium]|nr:glucosamine-6-phosphate deaminase [Chitinophagaceae bacterium]
MITETLIKQQFTSFEKIPVTIFNKADDACKSVSNEIASLIRSKQQQSAHAVLGLATGSTPLKIYQELVRMHKEEGLSFKNVISFNLDEYYPLPPESLQSYRHFMQENLFKHIDIDPANCHIPSGQVGLENVKQHCEQYEELIKNVGGIDFQLLGIGRNGHIGFNEPGSHISSVTRLITLDKVTRFDAAAEFNGIANIPRKAITMGVHTVLNAKRIVLLAWGERKADIVKLAVEGPISDFVPASYLQTHQNTSFVLDEAAAAILTRKKTPWLTEDVIWTNQMIKKAVIHLALSCEKPILKLTNNDYNENGLSSLLVLHGNAYDINIKIFNGLQHTITGWPGGKPNADDTYRPERAEPSRKRVIIFSPHPDDDIISMGGTFQRLADQGHDVHVAYQTSGNIAVADDEAFRFVEFVKDFNTQFTIKSPEADNIYNNSNSFLKQKKNAEPDTSELRFVKGLIRKGEATNTCRFVGIPDENIHFLNLPFYETGTIEKKPIGEDDIHIIASLIQKIKPHQIYAAGDLADPHGTHKVCLDGIFAALNRIKQLDFMKECWLWLYKGAWAEWDIDAIEMAVPMSPEQLLKKRYGIFKHQSQKDGVVFQGTDSREFWQRAEDRNKATAEIYNQLGLAEYEAMEAFVRWHY